MNIKFEKGIKNQSKNIVIALFEGEVYKYGDKYIDLILNDFNYENLKIEATKVIMKEEIINLCLVNMGKREKLDKESTRVIAGNLIKKLKTLADKEDIDVDIFNLELEEELMSTFCEGLLLGEYEFTKYKTKLKDKKTVASFVIHCDKDIKEKVNDSLVLATATNISRDLVNEPSNIIYPKTLANKAIELGKEYGFEVEVYDEDKIKELEMKAFLSVARGSSKKPKFIVMRHLKGSDSEDILGLVGKGLTYDTGGYSIKPTSSMYSMKTDMGGAASVIGAMCAIAKNNIEKNVVAVVAACENAISGDAYKPGDIIESMANKTIEIANTDAEGRLTLADAIYYTIQNEKATKVVDIATLTGAAISALGSVFTPVISNDDDFYKTLEESANISGEKIWRMPILDEFKAMNKGNEADLKNSGGREAGTITAGLFIGEFVGETPWIHMDIAGTSETNKSKGYKFKGATGEGVRTLYYLAKMS